MENEGYLARLIVNIHQNPRRHGFVKDYRDWPFSSYHVLLANHPTFINPGNVMKLFGGRRQWDEYHRSLLYGMELGILAQESFL